MRTPKRNGGNRMIRTLIATAAVAAAVFGAAGPATAGPRALPDSDLELSYTAEAGYAAAVWLTCHPAGGGHPKPGKACATLDKVDGEPGRIKPTPAICTLEYAPITAAVTGTWKGRPVSWSETYPNHCDMIRSTRVLFRF
jgi:hypothetical protein